MEKECSRNKLVYIPILSLTDLENQFEKMIKGNYRNASAGKNNTALLNPIN